MLQVLLREGHAFDAQNRPIPCGSPGQVEAIKVASTAEDMYHVIQADSWVVVPIQSIHRPGQTMEGTRLTLVKVGENYMIRGQSGKSYWLIDFVVLTQSIMHALGSQPA